MWINFHSVGGLFQPVKGLTRTYHSLPGRCSVSTWLLGLNCSLPASPACQAPLTTWDLSVSVILYTDKCMLWVLFLGDAGTGLLSSWTHLLVVDQERPLLRFGSGVLGEDYPFLSHSPGLLSTDSGKPTLLHDPTSEHMSV